MGLPWPLCILFLVQGHCGHWGMFWEGHHAASGCRSIGYALYSLPLPVGTGGFSGRAIMRPRDVVLLLCPLVTPTPTLLQLGLLLPLSTRHSLTHSTPPGLAVLRSHQALEASTHYFSLVCFFPSPLPLVHSLTLPQQVSSAIHGSLVVWVIWVFIECES